MVKSGRRAFLGLGWLVDQSVVMLCLSDGRDGRTHQGCGGRTLVPALDGKRGALEGARYRYKLCQLRCGKQRGL